MNPAPIHPPLGPCFTCDQGGYQEVTEDFVATMPNGETMTVPAVVIFRCDTCGKDVIPPESSRKIEHFRVSRYEGQGSGV